MKKFLLKLMTVVLAVAMITGTLASCGLFEVNTDRDLERAAAVVNIDKGLDSKYGVANVVDAKGNVLYEGEPIFKRELIAGFMSYGYMYVQNYGYSLSDTYSLILDNLINNKIIMQYAKGDLAKHKADIKTSDAAIEKIVSHYGEEILAVFATDKMILEFNAEWTKGKADEEIVYGNKAYLTGLAKKVRARIGQPLTVNDPLVRFLDYDAILKSVASTIDSVNALIETFMDEQDVHEHENISYTVRTTPTMDEEEETALTEDEIKKLTAKTIKLGTEEKRGLAKAKEQFVKLGLVDSHETYEVANINTILNLTYFRTALVSTLESEVITNFEEYLRDKNELKADNVEHQKSLWDSYVALAKSQQNQYEGNVSGLESALGAVSNSTFVAYNSNSGYGYVSHFLIQYDDELKAELDEAIEEAKKGVVDHNGDPKAEGTLTNEHKQAIVDEYAQKIIARDLRASWVESGYGVLEGDTVRFTDDYVYTDVLATYNGTFERVSAHEEEDEDGNTILSFNYFGVKPTDISFADFNTIVNSVIDPTGAKTVEFNKVDNVEYSEDLKERFEDLKFAFSSDEGNFNSYLGYLYSPETSSTQYVSAFAKAAEEVCAEGKGAGYYKMFGSYEYGLHIVLCTKMVNELIYTATDNAGKAEFIEDLAKKGTVAYDFLEATNALIESNVISKLANTYVQHGLNEEGVVVKNDKVLKDLIEEAE